MNGWLWCEHGNVVYVPYPKLLATPTTAATMAAVGSFASIRTGSPGVRKKPFWTEYVNVFESSLKNRMPFVCGVRKDSNDAQGRSTRVSAVGFLWNWKLPAGTTSPSLPGPTICAHS